MLPDPLFLNVHMYGIMIAIGILGAFAVLHFYGKKLKINQKFMDFVFYDAVASIVGAFAFAALFQATYNYIKNPEAGFRFGQGLTFLGGLLGGTVVFVGIYFIFRKKAGGRLLDILSIVPCAITLCHGFGRIGCFFAGCCYGIETDSWLGVKFPNLPNKVYPTQLFEAAFLFILFAVLTVILFKTKTKHNLSIYLISYGVFRYFIEYIRGDDRGANIGIFSPSQFWSIVMVIAGIGLIFLVNYLTKKQAEKALAEEALSEENETPEDEIPEVTDKEAADDRNI